VYAGDNIYQLKLFGKHNLLNLSGAKAVCNQLGIKDDVFFEAVSQFRGATKRLELVDSNERVNVYKDFAHSPSKLKATINAVKEQYPDRELVSCMELHTFSSLTAEFLKQYKGAMQNTDIAIVYFNPHTIQHKKIPPISIQQIQESFDRKDIKVYNDISILLEDLLKMQWQNKNLLMMSSGNFDGLDISQLAQQIISSC